MFTKLFALALIAAVHCRYVLVQDESDPDLVEIVDLEEDVLDSIPLLNSRVRRQTTSTMNTNPDGSFNINAKTLLTDGDNTNLHALAGINGLKGNGKFGSATAGLGLENSNGHGASLTGTNIPGFGNQLTAAGRLGLIHNDDHKMSANAFITRNMPNAPNVPNFNTHGGSLNYLYKDKIGGSLGMAQTDFLKRTDYSAMGNLNLLRFPTSSLDLNAGFSKSVSPFILNSNKWEPSVGLSFTRYF